MHVAITQTIRSATPPSFRSCSLLPSPTRYDKLKGVEELLPGVEFACEATYYLTQADVDAAEVLNTATISGVGRDVASTKVRFPRGRQAALFGERLSR